MIDRGVCAHPVLRQGLEPCGRTADVSSDDTALPFAYCQEHGAKMLALLQVEVQVDLSERRPVPEKRQRLDALELALERA